MSTGATDPRWPRLFSLAAHELRSPLTVVAGYIRMLLKDRAGPLTDQQRRLLEEAEKSSGRLSGLVAELSEIASLESGTAPFNRSALDLKAIVADCIASLPPMSGREIQIDLSTDGTQPFVDGDAVRMRAALTSIVAGLRRELVSSDRLAVRLQTCDDRSQPSVRITIGDPDRIDRETAAPADELTAFDEWRGGHGLSLAIARRTVEAHGGWLRAPADGERAAAVLTLPLVQMPATKTP